MENNPPQGGCALAAKGVEKGLLSTPQITEAEKHTGRSTRWSVAVETKEWNITWERLSHPPWQSSKTGQQYHGASPADRWGISSVNCPHMECSWSKTLRDPQIVKERRGNFSRLVVPVLFNEKRVETLVDTGWGQTLVRKEIRCIHGYVWNYPTAMVRLQLANRHL